MKEKTLTDILQGLNKQYDNEPSEETAQKILDFVENELNTTYGEILRVKYQNENKIGASVLSGILMVALVAFFAKSREMILFVTFFASVIVTFFILAYVEQKNEKVWRFRHYVVLKKLRDKQKKQDEIKALEAKYLNNNSDDEGAIDE